MTLTTHGHVTFKGKSNVRSLCACLNCSMEISDALATKPSFGILVIGFNRPAILQETLDHLRKNADLSGAPLFFSLDGPRSKKDAEPLAECATHVNQFTGATKQFSVNNIGLRRNILDSVTKAFESVDKLLVLEDDCLLGPGAIAYFNWAFKQMDSLSNIGVISGTYFGRHKSELAFTANRFSSWGWATNKEVWGQFMASKFPNVALTALYSEISTLTSGDPFPYRFEYRSIKKNLHKLDSWAIPFDMFLRSEKLLSLKPGLNQIRNIGFNEMATHTSRGKSLSIPTSELRLSTIRMAGRIESARLEWAEAWSKISKLAIEWLLDKTKLFPSAGQHG